jgi:predicted HAD superfamily Cof-like phosphohydrolase
VKVAVFSVRPDDNNCKNNQEETGKNQLSGTKHISIFTQIYFKTATMKYKLSAVEQFHNSFGLGVQTIPKADLAPSTIELRYRLMDEENREYLEAAKNGDLIEVADALGDMLYSLCGTILEHGMQHKIEAVFEEIQRSNMSKLGTDGKPLYRDDGKVLKGPSYFKPDIKRALDI